MAEQEEKGPLEKPIDWLSGWKASFERTRQRFGMPVAVLLALSVAGGLVWWNWDDIAKRPGVESVLAWVSQKLLPTAPVGQTPFRIPPAELKQTSRIAVECRSEMLPKTLAPTETVRALLLFPLRAENGGGGLPTFFNFSGKEWQWPGPFTGTTAPMEGYRCEITNYDAVPIFDFLMLLDLTFFETVDVPNQPNSKSQGSVKLRRGWQIDVPKIDVGPANSFVFYIFNYQADQFVNVLMPKTAIMRRLGETEARVINLTVPTAGGQVPLMLWPHFNANSQK